MKRDILLRSVLFVQNKDIRGGLKRYVLAAIGLARVQSTCPPCVLESLRPQPLMVHLPPLTIPRARVYLPHIPFYSQLFQLIGVDDMYFFEKSVVDPVKETMSIVASNVTYARIVKMVRSSFAYHVLA
jgi:PRELI-like family protein